MAAGVVVAASIVLGLLVTPTAASRGDATLLYNRCVEWYRQHNCSHDDSFLPHSEAPTWLWWFGWSCADNCRYECMWITVDAFQDDSLPIPQFHGKWPFVRLLGIQEPASALASLLNFAAHLEMTLRFLKQVPNSAPLYTTWLLYSMFSMNAWLCSTIFHTKDTPLTEKMDYFGALSYMLCSLYACIARIYLGKRHRSPPRIVPCLLVLFFVVHVSYLTFVKFDYKYNLIVNVGIGALSSFLWLCWCLPKVRLQPHNGFGLITVLALNGLVGLELLDFAPIFWILDAHALWHTGTILLAVPWYKFIIEDCRLMAKSAVPLYETRKTL